MNSWPLAVVDWRRLTGELRDGDLICVVHGQVTAAVGPRELPICPQCRQLLVRARRQGSSGLITGFAEPYPAYCAGSQRHPYAPGGMRLGWRACACRSAVPGPGGHRWWMCVHCDAVAEFPQHQSA